MRGKILKALVAESQLSAAQIVKRTEMDPERVKANLSQLAKEGFIKKRGKLFDI